MDGSLVKNKVLVVDSGNLFADWMGEGMGMRSWGELHGMGSVFGGMRMRGWGISLGCWGMMWVSFVLDISDEAIFMISMIGDNLGSAVGKSDSVFSSYDSVFVLVK